ncbi:O-fucosyltransferase 13-like isoform X1 [Fagus crenata]
MVVLSMSVKALFSILLVSLSLLLGLLLLSPPFPFSQTSLSSNSPLGKSDIWSFQRMVEWRPCYNGYIRVDCYVQLCDGVGIARLLNATLVLPKFEVAAYWNESSGFADVFDVDYFVQQMNGFIKVLKELPPEIASKEPFQVDCSKRKGQFDYIESVLPSLLEHHYISITPAMSQRRDSTYFFLQVSSVCEVSLCQACYNELRLTRSLEKKAFELLELARVWRKRGKCPLTPNETTIILQALSIPRNTHIYLAAGDGLMEIEGLTSVYANVFTKSSLRTDEDFTSVHGNTKAALDYYVSINSNSYMVAAMRAFKGLYKTLFLSRRAFAEFTSQGFRGKDLMQALWKAHTDDYVMGRGSALPDCFCEFKL